MDVENCERKLVERCLSGQESAYREFVDRFKTLIYGVCLRMLGDRHEAEDVSQEVFVRAIRSLHRWDSARPLRPWLLTIASNRCRTQLSRRRRQPAACEFTDDIADHRAEQIADGNELLDALKHAVSELREDYRRVFLLYHEQGLSYEEMAEQLDKPIGTLKTWLHRARKQLLAALHSKGLIPEGMHELSNV